MACRTTKRSAAFGLAIALAGCAPHQVKMAPVSPQPATPLAAAPISKAPSPELPEWVDVLHVGDPPGESDYRDARLTIVYKSRGSGLRIAWSATADSDDPVRVLDGNDRQLRVLGRTGTVEFPSDQPVKLVFDSPERRGLTINVQDHLTPSQVADAHKGGFGEVAQIFFSNMGFRKGYISPLLTMPTTRAGLDWTDDTRVHIVLSFLQVIEHARRSDVLVMDADKRSGVTTFDSATPLRLELHSQPGQDHTLHLFSIGDQ